MKVYSLDQLNQVREANRLGEGGGLEHIKDHELEHIKDHDTPALKLRGGLVVTGGGEVLTT